MAVENKNQVVYRVRRFDPRRDGRPYWESFSIPRTPGMTVLDGLWQVKELGSASLAWRASCRMGVCGSCGMMINGSPRLACNTQVADLGGDEITLAPLPNFDILRDLVPDLRPMLDTHREFKPYIIRDDAGENERPRAEFRQTPDELESYLQFSYCIKCGCCMSACPTYATDPVYGGPMPLAQAHRYNIDTRDDGFHHRKGPLSTDSGPWRCHYAGECSRVCPKGVDPAKAVQLLKRDLMMDFFGLRRKRRPAELATVPEDARRRDGVGEAPARTVEA